MSKREWSLFIMAVVLFFTLAIQVNSREVRAAPTQDQPTVYLLTRTPAGTAVYWLETDRDECYIYAGTGISCLRKEQR